MNIQEYESLIKNTVSKVVENIISENINLNISAKSRAGAEISNFLEEQFILLTKKNEILIDAEKSPKGATKNPWDAKVYFKYNSHCEEIWIDF